MRNGKKLLELSEKSYARAVDSGLMQVTILERNGKEVVLEDGRRVTEFINCSYLGLDMHPNLIRGAEEAVRRWGIHFCCARSRFSIEPNRALEEELSSLFGARAITFPSVTATHMSVMPLVAAGLLTPDERPVRLLFDRHAHASMQYLKPVLAAEAEVRTLAHNDLGELETEVKAAHSEGKAVLYVADGVYSMGGVTPIEALMELAERLDFYLYIDDAHGTSILGQQGEGYILSRLGQLPQRAMLTYSLAKGFGCNGGGVLVPTAWQETLIRRHGVTYAFSAPLDFSVIGAALEAVKLHRDGTVAELQKKLWKNLSYFAPERDPESFVSPIVMVPLGESERAIETAESLKEEGFFTSVVFFPIVGRDNAQLRLCVSTEHTPEQLQGLVEALKRRGLSWKV